MGNKDDKTFTDIFSGSTNEPETTTKTFSDILNSKDTEEKDKTTPVTFDSIFDKISTVPKSETTVPEFDCFKQVNEKNEVEDELVKSSTESIDFNSIFDEKKEELVSESDNNDEAESTDESKVQTKIETATTNIEPETITTEPITFNPFFIDKKETQLKDTSQVDISINSNSLSDEDNTEVLNNNIFFQSNTKNESNTNILEEKAGISNVVHEQPNQEINFNSNPFLNNEPIISEKKEVNNIVENAKIEENPFFETSKQTEEKKIDLEPSTITTPKQTVPVQSESQESTVPKSISPFFEEEKKSEENPFFQNQLNLIENQVPKNPNSNIDPTKSKHFNVKVVKKKEPLIKMILGILSYALFIWLLLIGITLLVYVLDIKIRAAKGDYSSPTFNAYVVLTGSMLPEIQVKDVVVTKKIDAKDLKEGDVITFASADSRFLGTIITHRIIKKNPPSGTEGYTFQTQGDNNNVADSALVPENNIYGKVILKIPKLGYLQEFLASDGGWIIVILIPCLTVISYDIVKLLKGLKRKKYKNIKVQK